MQNAETGRRSNRDNDSGARSVDRTLRLLIVEDEPLVAQEVYDALSGTGLSIAIAEDGVEAVLWIAANGPPDIVLVDIRMPRMDGISFVSRMISNLPEGHQCAVIFASGHGTVGHVAAAMRLDALDFLEKPMDRMQVRAAVDRARRRLAERRNETSRQIELLAEVRQIRDRSDALMSELTSAVPGRRGAPDRMSRPSGLAVVPESTDIYADVTALLQRVQKVRKRILGEEGLDDTIWEMLLDLMAAHLRGEVVTVTSLCMVSDSPQTTALRRIEQMEAVGLVERQPDEGDRRRRIVTLTPKGIDGISRYLSAVSAAFTEGS